MNRIFYGFVMAFLCLPALAQERVATSESGGEFSLDSFAIAVLRTKALSNDTAYAGLADAVYREVLDQLATIERVHVVAPERVAAYAGTDLAPADIARQLGAATVLQTSVAPDSRGFSIRYAWIDARSGKHRTSGTMLSFSDWAAQEGIEPRLKDRIGEQVSSIERSLFVDLDQATAEYEAEKAHARARFLDTSRSEKERVAALGELVPPTRVVYPRQYIDDGASLEGEVAVAVAQMATESADPAVRSFLWGTMIGVGDTHLVDPLLHALANDPDGRVRAQAAKALAAHLENAGVQEALRDAMENDPDRQAREAASLAMASSKERWDLLRLLAMDDSRPERERTMALFRLHSIDRARPADSELVLVMADLGRTSSSDRTRRSVWSTLGSMGGADAVNSLVAALSTETRETVRESLVDSLSKHAGELPVVRERLEKTLSDDTSPLVRAAAARAIERAE